MRSAKHFVLILSFLSFADSALYGEESGTDQLVISIGLDALPKLNQQFKKQFTVLSKTQDLAFLKIASKELPRLSQLMHSLYGRCGGYVVENSVEEAIRDFEDIIPAPFLSPRIHHQDLVKKALALVDENNIRASIEALSSYRNRYYMSTTGVHSQEWVGAKWQELASALPNVELQYFEHADYPQRSVILTVTGTKKPNEIVIVGGHGDSIAGWNQPDDMEAPGADDNASGIATLTEALRVLGALGIAPDRTLKFISYAAEEVGLRGSKDIAESFRARNENVVGVVQLDMTNFTKRPNEIILMTDHTNASQNGFMKNLFQSYLPNFIIREDRCGYACSDHASWHRNGYPVSFPFETRMHDYNKTIHSAQDTIAVSENNALHSVPYAQILISYLLELGLL